MPEPTPYDDAVDQIRDQNPDFFAPRYSTQAELEQLAAECIEEMRRLGLTRAEMLRTVTTLRKLYALGLDDRQMRGVLALLDEMNAPARPPRRRPGKRDKGGDPPNSP